MRLRILFIAAAAAFLIGLCRADVSEIKAPKDDVSVPFNDLLPPLLADSTTAAVEAKTTTTTTTGKPQTTTLITKPTKKSYYQQQQTQLSKEEKLKSGTNKQQIQLLSLDLLPPFEDTSNKEDTPEAKPTTSRPIPKSQPPQHVAKVQPSVAKVQPFVARVQSQPQPQSKPQHQVQVQAVPKPQPHVARPQISRFASITPTSNPSALRQHLPSSPFFSAQFSNYFQSSTPRPRRGPLPTLTPFPHHIK